MPGKWKPTEKRITIDENAINVYMDVSKNNGTPKSPHMDGLFHGKAYEQMGWFGGFHLFLETSIYIIPVENSKNQQKKSITIDDHGT